MAEIKVTSQELKAKSEAFKNYANEFGTNMGEIKAGMQSMKGNWEGDAAESFITRFNQMEKNFESYQRVITEYATFLGKAAEDYEASENKVKSASDSIQNNLFA